MGINKKKVVIPVIICLVSCLIINHPLLTRQEISQDNSTYGLFYSDKLTPGTVYKWKFNEFNTTGFRDNDLLEYPIISGSIVELTILKEFENYNTRDFYGNTDPNDYFQLKIDEKQYTLIKASSVLYSFDTWVGYSEIDNQGQQTYYDYIIGEDLGFLYAQRIIYENTTELNRFEYEKDVLNKPITINGEEVTINSTGKHIEVGKSTGIVKKFTSEQKWNFPNNEEFSVSIDYEYLDEESGIISGMDTIIMLIATGSMGATTGLVIAIIIKRR